MDPLARFEFSQSSLQDYADCPHRFQLRYMQRVAWPAIQAEPARENEQHIQRGERFHRLVQQYLVGVPETRLTRMAETDKDPNLMIWWRNFIDCIPEELIGVRYVETGLETRLNYHRLVAVYDLILALPDGRVQIYDWKTSLRRPKRETLLARLQTRIYPYLLVQAGGAINRRQRIEPEQVTMTYWFADPAQPPEYIAYSKERYHEDEDYLCELIGQILTTQGEFRMADDEKSCRYCVYRSLCNRGMEAASLDDADGDEPSAANGFNFDLEQIGEISF